MMKTKQKTLLFVALSLLLCAALALGLTATQVSAHAADAADKEIQISAMGEVKYDGTKLSFIMGFDTAVEMFDNDYAYVGVFGGRDGFLEDWENEWFSKADVNTQTVTKEGDANTRGTAKYVRAHVNDVIGKYVYLNGVSIRDIALTILARKVPENPKETVATFKTAYQSVWEALGIRVSKEGNHINFFNLKTDDPFVASLLGCDADNKTLTKPLTVTIKAGYTAMDGTVLKQSWSVTYSGGAWGFPIEAVAADPTNNISVGGITSPGYGSAALGTVYVTGAGACFSVYFGEEAWYKEGVTSGYKTDRNWYWCVNAPKSIQQWVCDTGNGGGTSMEAVGAVMDTLGVSVREKIVFADADGSNEQTLGEIADSQAGDNSKYFQFDVLANIQENSLVFGMSKDIAFLGWQDGKIGRDFKITFKQGFTAMTGKTIAEDISFVYRAATGVFERDGITIPPEAPEKPITTPVTVRMQTFHDNGQSIGYNICFSENVRPREMGAVDVAGAEWVQDGFMLNGKTFGEIYEYAQENDYDFRVEFEARNQLTVWVDKRIPEEQGGLKKDEGGKVLQSGNTVVIKADIALPREAKLAYDDDIAFENSGANWTKAYIFPDREFTPVEVAGISNPSYYEDGKVKYTVTFGDDVASRQYFQIQANLGWLIEVNTGGGLNNLSEEELKRLEYYGIHSSIADKIVISVNGVAKTVRAWQESDPNGSNYNQGVLQIHYGQDGESNALQILWSGRRIGEGETQFTEPQPLCPSLDAEISITFKKGFRTPNCREIQEDVTFTYSGEAGAHFVKESAGVVYDTVTFQKVFYNGERIEENGTLTLPAGTFALDENLFTVLFAEGNGVTLAVTGADSLQEGNNTVTLTGTSGNASTSFSFTVVCSKKTDGKSGKKGGCGSSAASGALIAAVLLLCVSLSMGLVHKRRKA